MTQIWVPPGIQDHSERVLPQGNIRTASGLLYRPLSHPGFETLEAQWWTTGHREGLTVCISIDDTAKFGPMFHMSISHRSRYPSWDEIHEARDAFLPAFREFMMVLPRRGEYVNVHPNCFHLHEVPEELAG